jgi:surface antigen
MTGKSIAMKSTMIAAVTALALLAGGCANNDYGNKQTFGALSGAALGGLFGAQFGKGNGQLAATAAGAVIGGLVGGEIGRGLDDVDQLKAQRAQQRAQSAPLGQTIAWSNPDTGNRGAVTPLREGVSSTGTYCREFQQTIEVSGQHQSGYGTACRQADGSWEII